MARISLGDGMVTDGRTFAQLREAERLLGFKLRTTQGSYHDGSASAGTHTGGGVLDFSVNGMSDSTINKVVYALRTVGLWGWHRARPEWSGDEHIHAVSVGGPDLAASARRQIASARLGRNGLVNNLRDRHRAMGLPVISWEQYLASVNDDSPAVSALNPAVKPGRHHPQVKALQRALIKAGFGPIPGAVTDYYGLNTEAAVARFHNKYPRYRSVGLRRDVRIGKKGWAYLQHLAANS